MDDFSRDHSLRLRKVSLSCRSRSVPERRFEVLATIRE
jgi:hypothetical protein